MSAARWGGVLVLVLAAAAVAAQVQEQPPPSQGTDLHSSNCFKCHATGGGNLGPPLASLYTVQASGTGNLSLNRPLTLVVTVRNHWVAQLRDLSAQLDLSRAPDAGFTARPSPVLGVAAHGNLTFDATQPTQLNSERSQRVELPLPAGATAFLIQLVPGVQAGNAAPGLTLRLWAPTADPNGPPTAVQGGAGKGGTEVFRVPQANALLRSGTWLAEAAQASCVATTDPACLQTQPFAVVGDAWFNLTGGARQQTVPFPAPQLDGQHRDTPQESSVSWTYFLRDYTVANETLRVTVNTTAYYLHPQNAARYNDWPFTQTLDLPIHLAPQGGLITAPTAPAVVVAAPGVTLTTWGEIVGYLGSFTLAVSMTSGGAFGEASKRAINRLFAGVTQRIAFHNVFSYGVILFAIAHAILFLVGAEYHWSVGLLWGAPAILFMLLLGVTGAFQAFVVEWWGYKAWQVLHASLSHLTILFTLVHMGLDGAHFTWIPKALHWVDPIVHHFRG